MRAVFWTVDRQLLLVPSHGREQRSRSSIPRKRAPPSQPHLILITSPKPRLLIITHGGDEFQLKNLGGGIQFITPSHLVCAVYQ